MTRPLVLRLLADLIVDRRSRSPPAILRVGLDGVDGATKTSTCRFAVSVP